MQLLLLTTDTPHHRWFAQAVRPTLTVVEGLALGFPAKRVEYESVNDAITEVSEADITIVYGTGRLNADLIQAARGPLLNLHGGDPERYRGLDSHLWAIYHRDWPALMTTLHHVEERLDTGPIVLQAQIPLRHHMTRLYDLREANTDTCVRLVQAALALYEQGWLPGREQRTEGRYYSSLPQELLPLCEQRFAEHTASLPTGSPIPA